MSTLCISIGVLLVLLGIGGYVATDMVSPTALIPAAFGLVLLMLGVYGRAEAHRRTAMHLAMGVALVGIIGTFGGVHATIYWLGSGATEWPAAALSKAAMALLLALFLGLGIRSFVRARRR